MQRPIGRVGGYNSTPYFDPNDKVAGKPQQFNLDKNMQSKINQ